MIRAVRLFALLAIAPLAFNSAQSPAWAMATNGLLVPICTGDGQARVVVIPKGGDRPRDGSSGSDCVKGCHAGPARKRAGRPKFEPAQ